MRYSLMGLAALAWLALARPHLQVEHVVVLVERPAEEAAPAGSRDGGQTQPPRKPAPTSKGSTMR